MLSGSGISWAICKSAPSSRQITTPAPHHSVFFTGQMPFLPPNQQRQSAEGTKTPRKKHQKLSNVKSLTKIAWFQQFSELDRTHIVSPPPGWYIVAESRDAEWVCLLTGRTSGLREDWLTELLLHGTARTHLVLHWLLSCLPGCVRLLSLLRCCGHVLWKEDDDWVMKCMEYWVEGPTPRGRPNRTWKENVVKDCQARKLNKEDAADRSRWRKMIKDVCWTGWVWVGECFF